MIGEGLRRCAQNIQRSILRVVFLAPKRITVLTYNNYMHDWGILKNFKNTWIPSKFLQTLELEFFQNFAVIGDCHYVLPRFIFCSGDCLQAENF